MKDRVSLYPGRVKLTPVPGQSGVYDMERADQPTQEGTALNKNNLLKDATAALYGLDANAVPDDVFEKLSETAFATTETIYKGEERSAVPCVATNTCAAFDGSKFLMLGSDKGARISTDGVNWTSHTTNLTATPAVGSLGYGAGKFVVGLQSVSSVAYSTDGISWTTVAIPGITEQRDIRGIKYVQGRFIGVVNNSTYGVYSYDGVNWNAMNLGGAITWVDVAYGNGIYIAIHDYDEKTSYSSSTDGINWTWHSSGMGNYCPKQQIIFANGKFVVSCGYREELGTTAFSYSENGSTWRSADVETASININYRAVGWTGKEFVSFGAKGAIVTSPDGITWTKITSPTGWPSSGSSQQAVLGNGVFVAPSAGGAYVYVQKPLYQRETVLTDVAKTPLSILADQIVGGVKIATGSYTGTGTYGADNPNSLTFDFVPKAVIVDPPHYSQYGGSIWIYGATSGDSYGHNANYGVKLTWNGNTLSWYSAGNTNNASYQLNSTNITYQYIAIG